VGSSEERRDRVQPGDPSQSTLDIIRREIAHLSDRVDLKIDGVVAGLMARVEAIEKATKVFSEDLNRVPTDLQTAIAGEHALTIEKFETLKCELRAIAGRFVEYAALRDEKFADVNHQLQAIKDLKTEQFHAIQQQFVERDVRVETAAKDTKISIDAALSAAEKATAKGAEYSAATAAKSEAALAKQADQQAELFRTTRDQQAELFRTTTGALQNQINEMKQQITRAESIAIGQAGQKTEQHQASSATMALVALAVTILSVLIGLAMRFVGR
jgi:hypothetical protein